MTSEASEPEAMDASRKPSGEERSDDPRGSDAVEPEAMDASRKPSGEEHGDARSASEHSSGERSEPRERSDDPRGSDAVEPEAVADGGVQGCSDPGEFYEPGSVEDVVALDPEHEARVRADGGDVSIDIADHESPSVPDSLFGEDDGPDDPEPDESGADGEDVEPVELLVQLAKDGEIEPWDIDIVEVTDKFLAALDDVDLRTSGRALFYASVLLRMKSDVLLEDDEEAAADAEMETEWDAWEEPVEGGASQGFDPVDQLEAEMERRLDRKNARGKPETLDELVRDLRDAERGSWWKESRTYDTSESPRGFSRGVQELDYHAADDLRMEDEPSQDEALGTAHDEDMEATIDDVYTVLLERFGGGRTEVLFEEVADAGPSRVETFLAMLFLAHRGSVLLEQPELFGDLWVRDKNADEDPRGR